MVGSAISTTTPESRTDKHKETCAETSERCLICIQVHLNPDSIRSLAHFSVFFWQFRVPTVATAMNATEGCTDNFSVRPSHVITREAQDIFRSHLVIGHVFAEHSVKPRFLLFSLHLTTPTASPTPLTGIRPNSHATSLGDGHPAGPIPNTENDDR